MFKAFMDFLENSFFENQNSKNEKEETVNIIRAIINAGMGFNIKKVFNHAMSIEVDSDSHLFIHDKAIKITYGISNAEKARKFAEEVKPILGENNVATFFDDVFIAIRTPRTNLFAKSFRLYINLIMDRDYRLYPEEFFIRHQPMLITILNTLNDMNQYSINDPELSNECLDLLNVFTEDMEREQQKRKDAVLRDKEAIAASLKERLAFEKAVLQKRKEQSEA